MEIGTIGLWTHRTRGESEMRGAWLLTLVVGVEHSTKTNAYPQCRAVVDDFGNLVIVGGWL